ncbi:MAG TPA: serine hydrolase domain-containing protein [Solirubrobacterales bacterium]|nr:serine hydrolase domain-containing protein [Solirubrobacterales bacterium]
MYGLREDDWVIAPGFEPVAEEFRRNFAERDELGAAFAVVREGRTLLDLWGGNADARDGRPWERDTLQVIFSGTKGLVAICLLMLIDRGQLDLDSPVCEYWPEFAAAGKEGVTVRQVVSHSAGLPAIAEKLTVDDLPDDRRMAALLAAQPQFEDPRAFQTYHGLTYGWLCGELVRRIDGRSIGRFFAEEIAAPLGLELWIGLPPELEPRVTRIEIGRSWEELDLVDPEAGEDALREAIWGNPKILVPDSFPWNSTAFHAAEIPGAGGIGTARSVAKLYDSLGRLVSAETLALGTTEIVSRRDALLDDEESWAVGFMLQTELAQLGPPGDAFGHSGAGGSEHGRWPSQRLGFSYAMNRMQYDEAGDPRSRALLAALHACAEP